MRSVTAPQPPNHPTVGERFGNMRKRGHTRPSITMAAPFVQISEQCGETGFGVRASSGRFRSSARGWRYHPEIRLAPHFVQFLEPFKQRRYPPSECLPLAG